jgi:hypothetical protein
MAPELLPQVTVTVCHFEVPMKRDSRSRRVVCVILVVLLCMQYCTSVEAD